MKTPSLYLGCNFKPFLTVAGLSNWFADPTWNPMLSITVLRIMLKIVLTCIGKFCGLHNILMF